MGLVREKQGVGQHCLISKRGESSVLRHERIGVEADSETHRSDDSVDQKDAMISLNEAQQAAVTSGDGPALVLAGAGSGKTRVIVERLVWLAEERGVDPRHLLALTFTNKAAAEMRQRFAERLGAERVSAWLGTFHSFGLFLLRREIEALGRPRAFTVFDDSDQLSLMKRLVKELPARYERVSPRDALTWISLFKQRCGQPEGAPQGAADEAFRALWDRYHDTLSKVAAVDFDDLLTLVVKLFDRHPEVLAKYQRRYVHVLVDEYQDTNRAQYLIALALSKGHGNLFVVGDEDQSIYSWRGADIDNILDFGKDFPKAAVYRLERNYRSTKEILDVANAVVAHNLRRLGKNLYTTEQGDRVRFYLAETGEEEAAFVARDLVDRMLAPGSVAVLYRTNAQSRQMEEALRNQGLPYAVIGGIKFYGRKEIKDILAYLRLIVNAGDDESVRRVLNVPPRGIGEKTLEIVEAHAAQRGESLLQVLRDAENDMLLPARARESAAEFAHLIDDLAVEAKQSAVAPLVEKVLERLGYREHVQKSDEKDFRSRLEIVDEFIVGCRQYDKREGKDLLSYLQDLALESDVDEWDPEAPVVTLMTCHNAKGLEFAHVYLIGLEEGLLPFFRDHTGEDEDIEEERRLCYVAMTRARTTLTLVAAQSRMLYGRTKDDRQVSRFVFEAGMDRLERIGVQRHKPAKAPAPQPESVNGSRLKTGTRVHHARFGAGIVMYTQGEGERLKAHIRFNTGRSATLMVEQAPLRIIEEK